MEQRINIKPDPCFERIRKTLLLEGMPDRLPLCDFGVSYKLMEWVAGGTVNYKEYAFGEYKWNMPVAEDQLKFWYYGGYDYVHVRPLYYFNLPKSVHQSGFVLSEDIGVIKDLNILHNTAWPWQKPDGFCYSHIEEMVKILPEEMKIILSTGDIFTHAWEAMGFTHFCNSIYEEPELIEELMNQLGEAIYILNVRSLEKIGNKIGAIWYTDDLAFNTGTFVNPDIYRKYLFPWVKKLTDLAKSLNVPFLYHTDGSLWQVFDDFYKLGINAIHPLEPKSMDAVEVKQKWGHRFCLVGNIELDLLSRGEPEEVEEMVRDRIEKLGYNGGYCIGSSNTLAHYVNPLNFKAMVEATFKYGKL